MVPPSKLSSKQSNMEGKENGIGWQQTTSLSFACLLVQNMINFTLILFHIAIAVVNCKAAPQSTVAAKLCKLCGIIAPQSSTLMKQIQVSASKQQHALFTATTFFAYFTEHASPIYLSTIVVI